MAGVGAPALSIAVMQAGGLGSCGALLMSPAEIIAWAKLNFLLPDSAPH